MEVPNIVQEAVIKTTPKKRKYKKLKWSSEEALEIAKRSKRQRRKGKIYPFECRVANSKDKIRKTSSVISDKK